MKKLVLGVVAVLMSTAVTAPAYAAKVVPVSVFNETFENNTFGKFTPQGKVNVVTGKAYTNIGFTGDAAAQANHYASFGSGNTSPSAGSLLAATINGAADKFTRYTLSFDAGVIGADVLSQYLSVAVSSVSGEVLNQTIDLTGSTNLNAALQPYSFTFDAKGPISFNFFGGGNPRDSADTLLDNVSVTAGAVPEMGTWGMMIVGFGAIGGTLRTRRRREKGFGGNAFAAA